MFVSAKNRLRRTYDKVPRKDSRVISILGVVLFFASLMLLPSTVIAIRMGEEVFPFMVPMVVGITASVNMCMRFRLPRNLHSADGLMMMFSVWILLYAYGMLPYLLSGVPFIDAFFESVSGFSTTGATIITDFGSCTHALLMWRTVTSWIGGIIIVLMFMFLIPMVVSGGRTLLKNEMSGSGGNNLFLKLGTAAKQFIIMYTVLTGAFTGVLLVQNVGLLDSVTIAMSSISIGGFMNTASSISDYSVAVQISVIVFMIISATNFYLHYRVLFKRDFHGYRDSEEFTSMILWFLFIVILISSMALMGGDWDHLEGNDARRFVDILFTVVSIGTTTGFSTVDMSTHWPFLDVMVFMILMFVGGSSGSTSGGVKVSRMVIILKALVNEIRQEVHPNAVYSVRLDRKGLSQDTVHNAMTVVVLFLLSIVVGAFVFDFLLEMDDAVFVSISMLTNTGAGPGAFSSGYAVLPAWAKAFCCVLMFMGRMEILAIVAIFTRGFWVEFLGQGEINRTKTKLSISNRIRERKKHRKAEEDVVENEGSGSEATPEDDTTEPGVDGSDTGEEWTRWLK